MSDHTALIVECLADRFDAIDIVCAYSSGNRARSTMSETIVEYHDMKELFDVIDTAIRRERPEAILFQYVPHMWGRAGIALQAAIIPFWLRIKYGIPIITYLHELYYGWTFSPKRLALSLIHRMQLLVIGIASHRLIVTNFRRQKALRRLWGYKLFRIPAGNVSARTSAETTSEPYPWPYITWFGTLSEDQRVEELIFAYCDVANQYHDLRLVLVGGFDLTSPRLRQMMQIVEGAGLASRVIIRGFVSDDELTDILSGSTVNVATYATGPSGRRGVVAAYLRSGRPMVALDGPETDPEFRHGQNIILVHDNDIRSLSSALEALIDNRELSRRIAVGGEQLFVQSYSDASVAEKLRTVLTFKTGSVVTANVHHKS
ncbi:glycosyltransferase family 4 protein [Alicyclobacillus curvatus]|nr:glycosyltransferase family 4 protein [Alicyclobacillus curvatus]